MDYDAILFIALPVILVIVIAIILNHNSNIRNAYRLKLWNEYQATLKSGDKQLALNTGRKYYGSLRVGGRLTIYDEQALTNDLSAMK